MEIQGRINTIWSFEVTCCHSIPSDVQLPYEYANNNNLSNWNFTNVCTLLPIYPSGSFFLFLFLVRIFKKRMIDKPLRAGELFEVNIYFSSAIHSH